jgi:hypothetical protein
VLHTRASRRSACKAGSRTLIVRGGWLKDDERSESDDKLVVAMAVRDEEAVCSARRARSSVLHTNA